MVYKIADNVFSPLGETTAQNYQAVKAGRSVLRSYEHWQGIERPFVASLFTAQQTQAMAVDGLTRFESLAVASAQRAIDDCHLDVSQPRVLFILSTTKANIETQDSMPGESALRIAHHLGFVSQPVVVCNACISGVAAIMLAQRLLEGGDYDHAVVCGADVQSPFTVAGFLSLQALSAEPCRPFDIDRSGLNLGEAAATIVLSRTPIDSVTQQWAVTASAVRNDACHIITPAKTADGACLALQSVGCDGLAFINAHGTGTMFNDQMEAVAISKMELDGVPVNALKGYFGHTLGAAGILETVISMAAADDRMLLGTKGYAEIGTSAVLRLSDHHQPLEGTDFVKMISGFGGCNGALRLQKVKPVSAENPHKPNIRMTRRVHIAAPEQLTELYKLHIGDYPRFYKMDALSRLGFVAAELLLKGLDGDEWRRHCAVVLCNHSSSVVADRCFRQTLAGTEGRFPSPSLFVYTLPNIVTGEIAIRHHLQGETSFYILPQRDDERMWQLTETTFQDEAVGTVIGGWVDYEADSHFEADLFLAERS